MVLKCLVRYRRVRKQYRGSQTITDTSKDLWWEVYCRGPVVDEAILARRQYRHAISTVLLYELSGRQESSRTSDAYFLHYSFASVLLLCLRSYGSWVRWTKCCALVFSCKK